MGTLRAGDRLDGVSLFVTAVCSKNHLTPQKPSFPANIVHREPSPASLLRPSPRLARHLLAIRFPLFGLSIHMYPSCSAIVRIHPIAHAPANSS